MSTKREDNSQCLDTILHWAETWQMKSNIDKCVILQCTRLPSPIYKLYDDIIKTTSKHPFLGLHHVLHCLHHMKAHIVIVWLPSYEQISL